jgi:hypothetical protein
MTSRATRIELDAVVQESEWGTHLTMSTKSLNGLIFFVHNFSEFENCLIRSSATDISVLSIIGPPNHFMKQVLFQTTHERKKSRFGQLTLLDLPHVHIRSKERNFLIKQEHCNPTSTQAQPSTKPPTFTGSTTKFRQNLTNFLTNESGKNHIQNEVFQVMVLCNKLNLRIIPIHLLREDPRIKLADDGSKKADTDD